MTAETITIMWLVILAVLLGIEIATLGLTTIWFAGGALIAFLLSLVGAPLWSQIAVFFCSVGGAVDFHSTACAEIYE